MNDEERKEIQQAEQYFFSLENRRHRPIEFPKPVRGEERMEVARDNFEATQTNHYEE